MIRVVDASAIAALAFGEREKQWVETQTVASTLIAPPLLLYELGNTLWKKLRRFPEQADVLLAAWTAWCSAQLVAPEPIDPIETIGLARDHELTFYDATYLWLARDRGADLISLDGKLVRVTRSLGLHAPAPDDTNRPHTTPRSRN